MRAYDFDGTIYAGDSTVDFYLHCLSAHPALLPTLPANAVAAVGFRLGRVRRDAFKGRFLSSFVPRVEAIAEAESFWETHMCRVRDWYRASARPDDVIISASPEFLLRPACARLGVKLIATDVDPATGELRGPNMRGEEKVWAFRELVGDETPDAFYTDSLSDLPMMRLAKRAYLVRHGQPKEWEA